MENKDIMNKCLSGYEKTLNKKSKFFNQDLEDFWKFLLKNKNNLEKLKIILSRFNIKISEQDIFNNCDVSFIK